MNIDFNKKNCGWMILLAAILTIIVVWAALSVMNNGVENYMGYSTLVRKLPKYEAIPNLLTSIGGAKSNFNYPDNIIGLYPADRSHLKTGAPYKIGQTRTIIRPELVGFSANSFVNRDIYSDFFNEKGDRRKNPQFRYITKFNGLSLNPRRYSTPQYKFASI